MVWSVDARVPVRMGAIASAGAAEALLIEGDQAAPDGVPFERFAAVGHGADCVCCAPRSPAAAALGRLFQRRARGEVPFFRRVLAVTATAEADLAVWSALRHDPIASARFRPESD
jgi:hypothetical protein